MNQTKPPNEPSRQALGLYTKLIRCANAVTRKIHHHLKADGITPSQFGVLEALNHLGPMCQRDLAGKLLKTGGNVTLVVENLVRRGLVHRQADPVDKRFLVVSLTKKGERLIHRVFERHARITDALLSVLPDSDQRLLADLLKRLGHHAAEADFIDNSQ